MSEVAGAASSWAERYAGATRDVYRQTLLELAREDDRVFCIDSDMGGLEDLFGSALPHQYLNIGIAEANMMGMAAGLAATGKLPYANTICSFAAARACEQIKVDIASTGLPVRIVVTHSGFSAGHYGPTHHSLEDVAIMRSLPNMTVVAPADAAATALAIRALHEHPGPTFVRLGRKATPLVYEEPVELEIGRAITLRDGGDATIIAAGPHPVLMALDAAATLGETHGIEARVLDMHTIKPLDEDAVEAAARETGLIVTVEDHYRVGGLGGAVAEVTGERHPCPVLRLGVPDRLFDQVGEERELLELAGVSAERIVDAVVAAR